MNCLMRLAAVRGTFLAASGLSFLDEKYETPINDPPYFYKPNVDKDSLQAAFNEAKEYLEEFRLRHNIPGVTCAIAVDDLFPYIINHGHSDKHFDVKMHNRTKVRIGEMSMVFTAALIYHLENFGFTTLSQNIFGSNKNAAGLLNERWTYQGEESYKKTTVFNDGFADDNHIRPELDKLVPSTVNATKKCKLAYELLSWEAAQVKNSKRAFVYDQYFLTQGFTNTCVDIHDRIKLFRARYYQGDSNTISPAPFVNPAHHLGVNGILSTAYDMALFGQRLLANSKHNVYRNFLSPDQVSKMFQAIQNNEMTVFGKKTQNGDAYCYNNSLGASGILFLTGLDIRGSKTRLGELQRKISIAVLANKEITTGSDSYVTSLEALAREIARCFDTVVTRGTGQ